MTTIRLKPGSLGACISLFLIIFGLWQAYDLVMVSLELPSLIISALYLTTYGVCLGVFILFVKLGKSNLRDCGFKQTAKTGRTVLLSIALVFFYVFVTLAPGFMSGFGSLPTQTISSFAVNVARAILISLTTESIFRGYIFKSLTKNHGFMTSLYASSIMFSLHRYVDPVSIINLLMTREDIVEYVFTNLMPALVAGLFLGYMIYKTNWSLIGPVTFRIGSLLYFFFGPTTPSPPWWMSLTIEIIAYVCLIVILDAAIKEPRYRRRRYGLED